MIEIDQLNFIGRGLHRSVYEHPEDKTRCIKIQHMAGGEKESIREKRYCEFLDRRNISWAMLPKFHGTVDTSKGQGVVFDLIRDYDGQVSKMLLTYLDSEDLTREYFGQLRVALAKLRDYLHDYGIVTMTIQPKNILYKRTDSDQGVLYIVDNIGTSDFLPISTYVKYFARKKLKRKWARFEQKMLSDHSHNPLVAELLSDY